MKKIPQQAFTAEFKELAVQRVKDGQTIPAVGRELGISHQTVRNWVKAAAAGKLVGVGSRVVTPEEMELSRLRAEVVRLLNSISSGVTTRLPTPTSLPAAAALTRLRTVW